MNKLLISIVLSFFYIFPFCQEKKEQPNFNPYKFNLGAGMAFCVNKINAYEPNSNNTVLFSDNPWDYVKLHVDYTFVRRFAMGFNLERKGFFAEKLFTDSHSLLNIGVLAKYNFICKKNSHVFFEVLPVYSWFTDRNHSTIPEGGIDFIGIGYQVALGLEHFFGKHLGIYYRSNYSVINYKTKGDYIVVLDGRNFVYNNPQVLKLKYNAFGWNLGILVRI